MSYFKALVSKKKRRFQEAGFDLDLTYIKPNIVAMGFPSDNLEGVYRNHIEEVIRFLESRHKDHYKVYNLCSERHYDPSKFKDRVARYPFEDHNAPPFELIKPFCEDLDVFLKADERNVAFIHCKAGKGRTGVMICSYLLHNGHFKETSAALKYYGDARTRNAKGVTIPSQRRYVQYYGYLLRNQLEYSPTMVLLKAFEMSPVPTVQGISCHPYFIIWQQKVRIYQSKVSEGKRINDTGFRFDLTQPVPICGDVKVEFFHKERFKKERMFQFWFNTFFISNAAATVTAKMQEKDDVEMIDEDEPTLKTFELDSDIRYFGIDKENLDKAHKDEKGKIFGTDFKIQVIFSEADSKSEVGSESSSSSSLPRVQKIKETKHKKSRSMGSYDEVLPPDNNLNDEEDDFSDTDNDEEWNNELRQTQQTFV